MFALEDILNAQFFLLNVGHGYTDVGVNEMTPDVLMWHFNKLSKKVTDENAAREAQARAVQSKMAAARSTRRR